MLKQGLRKCWMVMGFILLSSLSFTFFTFFTTQSVAAKSYQIDRVEITAQIRADGSMAAEETRTYSFDDNFTFAYIKKNIVPDQSKSPDRTEPYQLSNFEVCDQNTCYQQLADEQIAAADVDRPPQTFYVQNQGNQYYIKWFYRSSQTEEFTLRYIISNAVTIHQDVAELYWQWIGDEWEVPQSHVTVQVTLPPNIPGDAIQAWAHGPLTGIVAIPDNNTVTFEAPRVKVGEFFEGRIILPKDNFTAGVIGEGSSDSIKQQEAEFIAQTQRDLEKKNLIASAISIFSLVVLGGIIFNFYWVIKRFYQLGKDPQLPQVSLSGKLWEPPSEINPAQVDQLLSGSQSLTPKAFTATILSLIHKRVYKMRRSDQKQGLLFKKFNYYLEKQSHQQQNLSQIEKAVSSFLEKIGTKSIKFQGQAEEVLPLEEISKWTRTHRSTAYHFFKNLEKITHQKNLKEGYFDQAADKYSKNYYTVVYFFLLGAAQFMMLMKVSDVIVNTPLLSIGLLATPIGIVLAIIGIVVNMIFLSQGQKRTTLGAKEAASWKAFKKHMEDYKKTANYPIDSIILWEKYLVYGTVLGVSKKALSQLPVSFTPEDTQVATTYWAGSTAGASSDFSSSIADISAGFPTLSAAYRLQRAHPMVPLALAHLVVLQAAVEVVAEAEAVEQAKN